MPSVQTDLRVGTAVFDTLPPSMSRQDIRLQK